MVRRGKHTSVGDPEVYAGIDYAKISQKLREELRKELAKKIYPINFVSNRLYTSGGWAGFIHWVESMVGYDKLVIPVSFTSATPFKILLSDDGLNYREVYSGTNASENYALFVKDRGDLVLVSTGSSGTSIVGSVYRSMDGGESWTKVLDSVQTRIYPIEFTLGNYALVGTCNTTAEKATKGEIYRSDNIAISSPTWSKVLDVSEGIRALKSIADSETMLAGSGNPNGAGIYRSTDQGLTWKLVKRFTAAESKAIYWFHEEPDGSIYACDVGGNVFESLDDGLTWAFKFKVKISASFNPVIRRTVKLGDYTIASIDRLGLCLVSFKDGYVTPIAHELYFGTLYSLCRHRGGLVAVIADRLYFSGKVETAVLPLWSNKSIGVAGDATSHFSLLEHDKVSIYIISNQAGTGYIQFWDEVAETWRDFASFPVSANTLSSFTTSYASRLVRLRFVPTNLATVSAWAVME